MNSNGEYVEERLLTLTGYLYEAVTRDWTQRLTEAIRELPENERETLELRFGLTDGYSRTVRQTSEMAGVPREEVRQLEISAMEKLASMISNIPARLMRRAPPG